MRAGSTLLMLLGVMYAFAGMLVSWADFAFGMGAALIGVGGLVWAKVRESRG